MKRSSGVLLNISSLPGAYGIGDLSKDTENFIEQIASTGFSVWQTLPITSIGMGNSPYSGISTYAGNYLYLSPACFDEGLLTQNEIKENVYGGDIYLTNYEFAKDCKKKFLNIAFPRITESIQSKIDNFVKENSNWVCDYAVYMCLKEQFGLKSWIEWDEEYRFYSKELITTYTKNNFEKVNFFYFEQYLFYSQWNRVKHFANEHNVQIFGDLPIYVSYDSVDVWANTNLFQLNKETLRPTKVAGVPPDYFAKEGQLWGNPLYNYTKMAEDDYKWWVNRMKHALNIYDIVRIDHFRGLYKYWAVDANATTAIDGEWLDGPQLKIIDAFNKAIINPNIIAEDLGIIDKDVEDFLEKSGYMGMRVMQFGFDGDVNNKHLPHNYIPNCVAYTGTHDNDTSLGWLLSLPDNVRQEVFEYTGCESSYGWANGAGQCIATKSLIHTVLSSCAKLAIIPMQDLCGYGSDTRMNTPGLGEGCWRYRTNYSAISCVDRDFICRNNQIYGRC